MYDRQVALQCLWQVQKIAGDDFVGVGVLVSDVPDTLPILPSGP